jgi:hypothetical protein
MIVKDLVSVIFDTVILYKREGDDFVDIYKGKLTNISNELLNLKVGNMGAMKKGIIDIRVE